MTMVEELEEKLNTRPLNITRLIKAKIMRWTGHTECTRYIRKSKPTRFKSDYLNGKDHLGDITGLCC